MHDLALHPSGRASGAGDLFGLSLCSGAAGLDLGLTIALPGNRTVGQPFSVTIQRQGADNPGHFSPQVARIIGECGPAFVF